MNKIIICSVAGRYLPERKHNSAGWDCKAWVEGQDYIDEDYLDPRNMCLRGKDLNGMIPDSWLLVPLGFKVAMPLDCHADIRPRICSLLLLFVR